MSTSMNTGTYEFSEAIKDLHFFGKLPENTEMHWSSKKNKFMITAQKFLPTPDGKSEPIIKKGRKDKTIKKIGDRFEELAKLVSTLSTTLLSEQTEENSKEHDKKTMLDSLRQEYLKAQNGIIHFETLHTESKKLIDPLLKKLDRAFGTSTAYEDFADADWENELTKQHVREPAGIYKVGAYNISFWYNQMMSTYDKNNWHWWDPIGGNTDRRSGLELPVKDPIFLGAIPVIRINLTNESNDLENLIKLGIGAVLSCVEVFEIEAGGVYSAPVKSNQWKSSGIKHLQITTPDFNPITQENIRKGVEFIRWNVTNGRKTYVHCKAGVGRSVLVVVCYLLKYHREQFKTPLDAIGYIKTLRVQAKLNQANLKCALEFAESLVLKDFEC